MSIYVAHFLSVPQPVNTIKLITKLSTVTNHQIRMTRVNGLAVCRHKPSSAKCSWKFSWNKMEVAATSGNGTEKSRLSSTGNDKELSKGE